MYRSNSVKVEQGVFNQVANARIALQGSGRQALARYGLSWYNIGKGYKLYILYKSSILVSLWRDKC
jgi:hypothetical protein